MDIFKNIEIFIMQITNDFDLSIFQKYRNVNNLRYNNFEVFENSYLSEKYL